MLQVAYTPQTSIDIKSLSWVRPDVSVALLPLQDARPDPARIRANQEDDTPIPVFDDAAFQQAMAAAPAASP